MKLLIVTQVVDQQDPVLGFFHRWLEVFAPHYDSIEVICLREGAHALPTNVTVHSLGKEKGRVFPLLYGLRFLRLVWVLRTRYDGVFVHMNQEYVLLAGMLWRSLGIPVYLWRNHYAGSLLTDIASIFCTNVFCTSKHSYTVKYNKTILMPVGIDTERFIVDTTQTRKPNSLLMLSRIAPAKRIELFIEALSILASRSVSFTALIVGSPLPEDNEYYKKLEHLVKERGLHDVVTFTPSIPNNKTPEVYRAHTVFVNMSPSGMFDKTIFEAATCGAIPITTSEDWKTLAGVDFYTEPNPKEIADRLSYWLGQSQERMNEATKHVYSLAQSHSLMTLAHKMREALHAHRR